jgi:antitoxin component of MazEF toxin-antitoxin module
MHHLRIWQTGNSLVITITKRIARQANLKLGSELHYELMKDGSIRLRRLQPTLPPPATPARISPATRRALSRGLKHPTARR